MHGIRDPLATHLMKRLDHSLSTACHIYTYEALLAERSKALRSGRSIFGCVGSNPTECIYFCFIYICKGPKKYA